MWFNYLKNAVIALILLIAIAYSCVILTGRNCRGRGLQKYVGRLQELKRIYRRHSAFWIGLYGCLWIGAMELWEDERDRANAP